jgi:PKD repeat protein
MVQRVTNPTFCPAGGGWSLENGGDEGWWDNKLNGSGGSCWWDCNSWYVALTMGVSQSVNLTNVSKISFDWVYLIERNSGDDTWARIYLDGVIIREGTILNEEVWDPFDYEVSLTGYHTIAIRVNGGSDSYVGAYGYNVSAIAPDLPPAPVAAFTGNPLSGDAPLQVQFTDESSNTPTSWLWSFGDGLLSSSQNPLHEYAEPGSYSVNLKATNAGGFGTLQKNDYVVVTVPPPTFAPLWQLQIGPS